MESIVRTIPYTQTGPKNHHYEFDEEDKQVTGTIYLSKDVWPSPPAQRITATVLLEED